eukprot:m.89761 g.89761  ORF g.89761 m.89761 type:complete len:78 (+) comp8839_c0_seq5:454-687(+)
MRDTQKNKKQNNHLAPVVSGFSFCGCTLALVGKGEEIADGCELIVVACFNGVLCRIFLVSFNGVRIPFHGEGTIKLF